MKNDRKKQLNFLKKRNESLFKLYPKMKKLRQILLKICGDEVVLFQPDQMVQLFLKYGKTYKFNKIKIVKGKKNDCHNNSLRYVKKHSKLYLGEGFGLSDDGLWRSHSWVWDKETKTIIETTVKREIYFGLAFPESIFSLKQES